jgi:C-terminal processing protease CtpA/Prc
MQGNVGLLRITHFPSPPYLFDARYGAAMELLRDTEALILDLTINHGGGTDTYGFFLSYFFDKEIEFGRMHWRNDPLEVIKTSRDIPGARYGETRPMFVAISARTFSAGEAVALQLKSRRRAVLVGTRTKGGAHGADHFSLPGNFAIWIVTGRGEGPDWEGSGVEPNVAAPAGQEVTTAHRLALERLSREATDPQRRQILRNVLANSIENLSSF